jgi:hypothetical protein
MEHMTGLAEEQITARGLSEALTTTFSFPASLAKIP